MKEPTSLQIAGERLARGDSSGSDAGESVASELWGNSSSGGWEDLELVLWSRESGRWWVHVGARHGADLAGRKLDGRRRSVLDGGRRELFAGGRGRAVRREEEEGSALRARRGGGQEQGVAGAVGGRGERLVRVGEGLVRRRDWG